MSRQDLFDKLFASLDDAMLDDANWPAASALVDELCESRGNILVSGEEGLGTDLEVSTAEQNCIGGVKLMEWTPPPDGIAICQGGGAFDPLKEEASMEEVSIIGIDLAKRSFQVHGARSDGSVAFRRKLSRAKVLDFLVSQPRCAVAMEACASAHHWGRAMIRLGHEVKLVPPVYVKAFVKRQKNDAADAEAICEAAQRPTMPLWR